ncbi:MAG: hypothetical protein COY38_04480 [Candidatus Aenigmarchaeota archaeon CG_4_10_14_0_8_um_filter_37_24]|nr:DUF2752 domain-containing protein [Candidatus Aenigmarchaeota archaeon]PIV69514.1 MAG: hypothetical protein COS07_00560 [Candidatus Aenigmarchaeota archaeon CG01_land_8_20_14_3_00_37_9]PIW41050.1 MAG: hypothetical protein COW21_03920 [Candidatus Aenigmarchaeota archaeon CG15_BIG_FIL_POST_REV_8_21_14_020_37_27]PIY34829.1 MAG: hypothetical protein COZ04_05630 [Candidatus Aenigmarchaeota archaeon CG_4_10_14_3_um_filter_37_21]PIZ34382.1 MAG: hypothetical protein COY38_04480 [Candidatus Aenigmarc
MGRLGLNFFPLNISIAANKVKKIIFDFLSFNTPKIRIFNLSSILLFLAILPTDYLSYLPSGCIFKNFILPLIFNKNCLDTGILAGCSCPACGMTRALSRLMHGDFKGAYNCNRFVFIVFSIMGFLLILDLIKLTRKRYQKVNPQQQSCK